MALRNLKGQTFDWLEVICGGPFVNGSKYWFCVCQCGHTGYIKSRTLINGKNFKSCCLGKSKNIKSQRFGRLVALHPSGVTKRQNRLWKFLCDCGNEATIPASKVISGWTKSCGCFQEENRQSIAKLNFSHGVCGTSIYSRWYGMYYRCYNPQDERYKDYGGRGITVCEEWHRSNPKGFLNFYSWSMENGYQTHLQLDRRDNDGPYSPDNCRWVTRQENMNNTRGNRRELVFDEILTASQACEKYSIPKRYFYSAINRRNATMEIVVKRVLNKRGTTK